MQTNNFLASIQTKRQKVQADRAKAESWYDANPLKASVLSGTAFELRELDRIESEYLAQVQLITDRASYAALPWYKKLFTPQP